MTTRRPPRLALAVLDRWLPDSSPLAGDLTEEFERGRSRRWFWWQVLAALGIAAFRRSDEIRPLRLVDLQPVDAQERSRRRLLRFEPVPLTGTGLPGIGGLGVVALALLVTLLAPVLWFALVASMLAGIALGVVIIAWHRRRAG
ncbi:MAG: hypothetical protein EHM24_19240 [Acidobacteria bacterium]|nr:MAG: hypothetical protein EHM24_19240 [Acidobacteriota bacterium]